MVGPSQGTSEGVDQVNKVVEGARFAEAFSPLRPCSRLIPLAATAAPSPSLFDRPEALHG